MQTISHSLHNINPIFTDLEFVYAITSDRTNTKTLFPICLNDIFKPIFNAFEKYGNTIYNVAFQTRKYRVLDTSEQVKTIIVCFSGGKDSTATALHYVNLGYQVYLYHLRGINKTYKDEWKTAQMLADKLGLPLIIEDIMLTGKQEWIEHPLKNMILANMALQYGIRNNITTNIAFGNFTTSTLDTEPFDVCGGDCAEMWDIYNAIIQQIVPDFEVKVPFTNFQDTLDILVDNPEIIQYTQSCIGPYRYRDYLKKNNEAKYNIKLPEHRCGSCWKCCLEYCIFCDDGIYEYNEGYYKHCLDVLRKTMEKETGEKHTLDSTWNHYFFYNKEKSRFYSEKSSIRSPKVDS